MMVGGAAAPRVLVADDDEAIRELLRDVLGAEGYDVDEAVNGAEAVERARANPPDAVLMDLMMPVVSGMEATATLKNDPQTADIPILAMSAGRVITEMAESVQADAFVAKPFDLAALISAVEHHAGRPMP